VSTEYQVYEARVMGADAVLLIVAGLDFKTFAGTLRVDVQNLGWTRWVEVHSSEDVRKANDLGVQIVGVNHRNLDTFELDMGLFGRPCAWHFRAVASSFAESGINMSRGPLRTCRRTAAHAVLVGTALLEAWHPGDRLAQLMGR